MELSLYFCYVENICVCTLREQILTLFLCRLQFVNRAYERLMGYSCEEITGCDFHELQTRGGGGHHNSLTMEPDVQGRNDANSPTTLNTGGRVSPAGAAVATTSQQVFIFINIQMERQILCNSFAKKLQHVCLMCNAKS